MKDETNISDEAGSGPDFEVLRNALREGLRLGLEAEAEHRGLELPMGLAERAAREPGSPEADRELRALFADEPPLALIDFDTPGIQSYLFRVSRPVDLLGGSSFIESFTDPNGDADLSIYGWLSQGWLGATPRNLIYAGGGGGLMLVASHIAARVAERLGSILRQHTHGDLSTIAEAMPVWPRDLSPEPAPIVPQLEEVLGPSQPTSRYSATVAALASRLRRRRSVESELPSTLTPELYIERCHACGRKTGRATRHGDGERICKGCESRRKRGASQKENLVQAKTFGEIVLGLDEDALAVLWADGANLGRAFQNVGSAEQHRALSVAVGKAMDATAAAAIHSVKLTTPAVRGQTRDSRWQTPLRGGDDLVVILPAVAAVEAISPMIDAFERTFDGSLDPGSANPLLHHALAEGRSEQAERLAEQVRHFGLGIGLAIAHHRFPIRLLVDYARQLLKSAKKKIDPTTGLRSAVDFMVLQSGTPLSKDIDALRRRHWQRPPSGRMPGLLRTSKPYSAKGWAELMQRTRLLRDVGASALHGMAREVDRSHRLSRSLWRYQHTRAKAGQGWSRYRQALGRELSEIDDLLWRPTGEGWLATDLLDARELYDLVASTAPSSTPTSSTPTTERKAP